MTRIGGPPRCLWVMVHLALGCDDGAARDAAMDADGAAPLDAGRDAAGARDSSLDAHAATTVELSVRVDGDGVIRSTPAGIDCGGECVAAFERGASVTLSALTLAGDPSDRVAWGGACAGSGARCALVMDRARSVRATFAARAVTLRVERRGDGAGLVRSTPPGLECAPPCEASFAAGTRVSLAALPAYRSTVEGWDDPACPDAASCTIVLDADRTLAVSLDHHPFVRLSDTDRDPHLRLRDDGLAADLYIDGGARSVQSVAPGSGVFYFEAQLLREDVGLYGFGVATASAPLTMTSVGATDQSFGVTSDGSVLHDGAWLGAVDGEHDRFGIVVDYRAASPVVYVVARGAGGLTSEVHHVEPLDAIVTPLHIFVAGSKRDADYVIEIEPGNDTSARPFGLDPRAALRAMGLGSVADALVLGFGDTYAGPADAPPIVTVPADRSVASGTRVTLTASALDAEDGDLSGLVEWELLSSPHYAGRERARGSTFSFTPAAVGLHPARARVRDHAGHVREATVRVRVPGPVAQHDPVRLVRDARSAPSAELTADGLRARWTDLDKYGLRANQSLYGEFWYFEITRLVAPANMGGGLVIGQGNLAPYSWDDVPASCSVNMLGAVWRDLIWQRDFPRSATSYRTFGFAVDYRGEHPLVYVVAAGEVIAQLWLDDAWVEIHPMLYGNPTDLTVTGEHDEAINFGASAFAYDPVAALVSFGVDASALEVGWGDAHTRPSIRTAEAAR